MERITDLNVAERQILDKVKWLLSAIRTAVEVDPTGPTAGIRILQCLRKETYEDLNQIQHEAMILRAARSLERNNLAGEEVEWYWNPRQTGAAEEPDLRGIVAARIEVSAEITASDRPIGTIDKRMSATLEKLCKMPGKRVYFVLTEAMERRASTKVREAGYQIEVRRV